MVKFQLIGSLLFLGASCSSASQLNLASIQSKIRGSYSAGVIASRIKGELYLKGVCLNKYMDDPIVTTIIRDTLVNFEVLTESEANLVQPEHLLLTGRNQYKLKVVDGSSTAWSKAVVLIVEKKSEITTWDVDDYDFHFIAYFTPNDYLWLRNLLMHDPKFSTDEWFLGCFMQVLNDNHFDSGEDNIPWTDSLTKIFSWGNRLENHMGHFGPWWADESETADDMINREGKSKVKACMDIIVLMYNLRSFFIHQTAENNFGMMINLAWHFSWDEYSGDVAMNLKCAYIW